MAEGVLIALIVAAAAGWIGWTLVLPKAVRRRLRTSGPKKGGCGDDCGC